MQFFNPNFLHLFKQCKICPDDPYFYKGYGDKIILCRDGTYIPDNAFDNLFYIASLIGGADMLSSDNFVVHPLKDDFFYHSCSGFLGKKFASPRAVLHGTPYPDFSKYFYGLIDMRAYELRHFSSMATPLGSDYAHNNGLTIDYSTLLSFSDFDTCKKFAFDDYWQRFMPHSFYSSDVYSPDSYFVFVIGRFSFGYFDNSGYDILHFNFDVYSISRFVNSLTLDFAPIVQTLGGTPSSDQLANLKSICQLLGVDTSENGLSGCELMKEYLKRLNQILGGTPSIEPNDNLKSISYLLGVDTSENGLSGCELSKDYVKRDGIMLGAEYA